MGANTMFLCSTNSKSLWKRKTCLLLSAFFDNTIAQLFVLTPFAAFGTSPVKARTINVSDRRIAHMFSAFPACPTKTVLPHWDTNVGRSQCWVGDGRFPRTSPTKASLGTTVSGCVFLVDLSLDVFVRSHFQDIPKHTLLPERKINTIMPTEVIVIALSLQTTRDTSPQVFTFAAIEQQNILRKTIRNITSLTQMLSPDVIQSL